MPDQHYNMHSVHRPNGRVLVDDEAPHEKDYSPSWRYLASLEKSIENKTNTTMFELNQLIPVLTHTIPSVANTCVQTIQCFNP